MRRLALLVALVGVPRSAGAFCTISGLEAEVVAKDTSALDGGVLVLAVPARGEVGMGPDDVALHRTWKFQIGQQVTLFFVDELGRRSPSSKAIVVRAGAVPP